MEFGFCAEDKVPQDHPIRGMKVFVEKILQELRHELADMYSETGRPSIPPETLLKSLLLMVLFSIRSERQFCSMLRYNLLFQWFLNMGVMDSVFDASAFSKNRERLLDNEIGRKFFEAVNEHLRREGLLGSEHFSVDGTLIEAWASLKSLKERDRDDYNDRTRGKKASLIGINDKYESTTDSEAVVARKPGVLSQLAYMGNVLMDNRTGLCAEAEVLPARGTAEVEAATTMLERLESRAVKIKSVGADAGYYRQEFISVCRTIKAIPHVSPRTDRRLLGIDGRTHSSNGYIKSHATRKGIEKIFGWLKTIGGWQRTKYRGEKRVSFFALLGVSVFNIMRSLKLRPKLAH
jgi:transposase